MNSEGDQGKKATGNWDLSLYMEKEAAVKHQQS